MSSKGFSLLELLVSLAIFSIVLAIAVPDFSKWLSKNRVRNFALGLASNINNSRLIARKDNVRVILVIAFSGSEGSNLTSLGNIDPVYYFIFEDKNDNGYFDNGDKLIFFREKKGCIKILSNSLSRIYKNSNGAAVGKSLIFFPVGVPLIGASSVKITVGCVNDNDVKYSVLLSGINGIAKVVAK